MEEIKENLETFSLHMRDIGSYKKMSKQRELELVICMKENSDIEEVIKARNELVTSNMHLVVYIANKYDSSSFSKSDLIQQGYLGLIRAANTYNPESKASFGTYASILIKQSISSLINEYKTLIHMKTDGLGTLLKIRNAIKQFTEENNYPPSVTEISKILDINENKISQLLAVYQPSLSLSTPIADSDDFILEDIIPDEANVIDEYISKTTSDEQEKTNKNAIKEMLSILSPVEQDIINKRYFQKMTLDQIGDFFGVSKQAISQKYIMALDKIRKSPISDKYANLMDNSEKTKKLLCLYRKKYTGSNSSTKIKEEELLSYEKELKKQRQIDELKKQTNIPTNNLSYFDMLMESKRKQKHKCKIRGKKG